MEDKYEVILTMSLKKLRVVDSPDGKGQGLAVLSHQQSNWSSVGPTPAEAFHNAAGEGFEEYVRGLQAVIPAKLIPGS